MAEPTLEELHIAALVKSGDLAVRLGDSITPIFAFAEEYLGFRIKYVEDHSFDTYYLTRDFIADLEERLLVTDEDWSEYRYAFKNPQGWIGNFILGRRATPEACLRALHAMGKLVTE